MPEAFAYLGIPVVLTFGVLVLWFGAGRLTFSSFFVANRSVGVIAASFSLAVCWIWVFALIVGPQKAYEGGVGPLAWFVGANTVAMLVFATFFARLRRSFPQPWTTFTEFIRARMGEGMLGVYTLGISGMMTYAVWAQLTGALVLLAYATGADPRFLVALIAFLMLAIALPRGMQSVFSADMVKVLMIGAVLGVAFVVFGHADGVTGITLGSLGVSGTGPFVFGWPLMRDFGIPTAISLISGIVIDQQMWQRSLSMRESAARYAPWIAVLLFAAVISTIGVLGLTAAYLHLQMPDPQLAGFAVVGSLLPAGARIFAFMIAAALLATGASALNAVSSTWAIDIARWRKADVSDEAMIRISRAAMVVVLLIGVALAYAGVSLVQMLLFIGTFRGALFFPTVLALFFPWYGRPAKWFTFGVLGAMLLGPVLASLTSIFTAGIAVLAFTAALCGIELIRTYRSRDSISGIA